MNDDSIQLAAHWRAAIANPLVLSGLEALYSAAATAIEARGPACWASGRCCNFEQAGHRLYVTGLEAAYAIGGLQAAGWPGGRVSVTEIDAARTRGGCPFQTANLCGIHTIKPLACRVYFCDKTAQTWQQELLESLIAQVRLLHDRHGVHYRYGEWRDILHMLCSGVDNPPGAITQSVALKVDVAPREADD